MMCEQCRMASSSSVPPKEYYSLAETARLLHVHVRRIRELATRREDPLPFRENFVLLEHSMIGEAPCFDQAIFTLRNKGFRPVLAHPERYPFFDGDICKKISNIKHDGTLIQINILSLAGFYGPDAERKACKILKKNLVDFIASDCHSKRYFDALHDFLLSNAANKLNKFSFLN